MSKLCEDKRGIADRLSANPSQFLRERLLELEGFGTGLPGTHSLLVGGTALGASGRSNNGLKLDVKTGKLSLWRLFPTFTFRPRLRKAFFEGAGASV